VVYVTVRRAARFAAALALASILVLGASKALQWWHLPEVDATRGPSAHAPTSPHAPADATYSATSPRCKLVPSGRQDFIPDNCCRPGPGESYRHSPVIALQITEEGSMANVRVVRSSGIKDLDARLIRGVSSWRYYPRPGCGVIESTMTVIIDFR
jgi:TonB family protein